MSNELTRIRLRRILALAAIASLANGAGRADTLAYSIYLGMGDSRTLLTAGSRAYTVADLDVRPVWKPPVVPFWDSSIELEGGFRVGVLASPEREPRGFGLWVRNDANPHEFSWNWFSHDAGQTYSKIKGAGRLRVQFTDEGGVSRIGAIEFLDDVELTYQENMCLAPVGAYSHVVLVTRGSVLTVASRKTAEANVHRAKHNCPPCPKATPGSIRAGASR